MKLCVQISDSRDVRYANLIARVVSFLQRHHQDHRLAQVRYDICCVIDSIDVKTGASLAGYDIVLTLLHYDDGTVQTVKKLSQAASEVGNQKHLAAVYSGNAVTAAVRHALANANAKSLLSLVICEQPVPGDEVGPQAGRELPPVEQYLADVLGFDVGEANDSALLRASSSTLGVDSDLQHKLINACSPLRHVLTQSKAVGVLPENFGDTLRSVNLAFEKLSPPPPKRISVEWRTTHTLLSEIEQEPSTLARRLTTALLTISEIEAYARSIGQEETDWKALKAFGATPGKDKEDRIRVLWVEDERQWHLAFKRPFDECAIDVTFCDNSADWLKANRDISEYDVVLLDMALQGQGNALALELKNRGIEPQGVSDDHHAGFLMLQLLRSMGDSTPVFVLSARRSSDLIQSCTRHGAQRYFVKGETNIVDLISAIVQHANERRTRVAESQTPRNDRLTIGGPNDPLARVIRQVDQIASSASRGPVYLRGEPGIGKTELAKELHMRSPRRSGPFVHVDCSRLTTSIVEGELLGYLKGAFTGADRNHDGFFVQADGGTLFLDEIDKIPRTFQDRLLTAIQGRFVRPLSAKKDESFDAVIVVASNADLRALASRNEFSAPLYDRISRLPLTVPPLRERADVVKLLFLEIVRRIASDNGTTPFQLTQDAEAWIDSNTRSGEFKKNMRDLEDIVERVFVFHGSQLLVDAATLKIAFSMGNEVSYVEQGGLLDRAADALASMTDEGVVLRKSLLDQVEGRLFQRLLEQQDRKEICRRLGMTDAGLRQKIKELRGKGVLPHRFE
jgi:DNA-binding NtrC family response regulator